MKVDNLPSAIGSNCSHFVKLLPLNSLRRPVDRYAVILLVNGFANISNNKQPAKISNIDGRRM